MTQELVYVGSGSKTQHETATLGSEEKVETATFAASAAFAAPGIAERKDEPVDEWHVNRSVLATSPRRQEVYIPEARYGHEQLTTWGSQQYRPTWGVQVWLDLQEAQTKWTDLKHQLEIRTEAERLYSAYAALSELGAFILHQLVKQEAVPIAEFAEFASGSEAWMAIARLMKAGLVDENETEFYLTEKGEEYYLLLRQGGDFQ